MSTCQLLGQFAVLSNSRCIRVQIRRPIFFDHLLFHEKLARMSRRPLCLVLVIGNGSVSLDDAARLISPAGDRAVVRLGGAVKAEAAMLGAPSFHLGDDGYVSRSLSLIFVNFSAIFTTLFSTKRHIFRNINDNIFSGTFSRGKKLAFSQKFMPKTPKNRACGMLTRIGAFN